MRREYKRGRELGLKAEADTDPSGAAGVDGHLMLPEIC